MEPRPWLARLERDALNGLYRFQRSVRSGDLVGVRAALETGVPPDSPVGVREGMAALHHAIGRGDVRVVFALLEAGADPNRRDALQRTPLHLAVRFDRPEFVGPLVGHGAAVDAPDVWGNTPLMVALKLESVVLVRFLLDAGASTEGLAYPSSARRKPVARPGLPDPTLSVQPPSPHSGSLPFP